MISWKQSGGRSSTRTVPWGHFTFQQFGIVQHRVGVGAPNAIMQVAGDTLRSN